MSRRRDWRAPVKSVATSDPEVVYVDLDRSLALLEATEFSMPRLSTGDLTRVEAAAADPVHQRRWRASRIATRIVLERAGAMTCRKADFVIGPYGSPTLADGLPHFNVSHSGNVMLIATSERMPLGIDLERLRGLTMTDDRRRRIVAAAVRRAHGDVLSPDNDEDVLRAWVRLEAAAKALGTGIGRLLTEEGVIGSETRSAKGDAACSLEIRDVNVDRGRVAAIAAVVLPKTVNVLMFPDQADALARFLARNDS